MRKDATSTNRTTSLIEEVVELKHFNIVVINGEEKEISSLSKEERQRLVDEWNRRALEHLGYKREKTA